MEKKPKYYTYFSIEFGKSGGAHATAATPSLAPLYGIWIPKTADRYRLMLIVGI